MIDFCNILASFNCFFVFAVIDKFPKVSPSLPQAILMSELSEDEDDEITVDVWVLVNV